MRARKNDDSIVEPTNEFCLVLLLNDLVKNDRVPDAIKDLWFLEDIKIVHMATITPDWLLMEKLCYKDPSWLMEAGERVIAVLRASREPVQKSALEYGRDISKSIVDYYAQGSFYAIILYGPGARIRVREQIGDCDPNKAKPGTMRAKYSSDSGYRAYKEARAIRNCIVYSGDPFKIELLFPKLKLDGLVLI